MHTDYTAFLDSECGEIWKRIGAHRRAGVIAPLFSLHSAKSVGIGEFPDLKLLVDWCQKTGLSVIQLLPLNDVGYDFCPYDAQSSIALDPMYLSPVNLIGYNIRKFAGEIDALRQKFPIKGMRLSYDFKKEKMALFRKIYDDPSTSKTETAFVNFFKTHRAWLVHYACYKILKEKFENKGWAEWPEEFRTVKEEAIEDLIQENEETFFFHQWLQWQLFEQLSAVKVYATQKGVFLMGDLPFLVARDSVDVWSHQNYYKLDLSSGAPPDLYFSKGQRWGMPPYNWDNLAAANYDSLRRKIGYAEYFFHLYRIDHFVGLFRLWTIPLSEPEIFAGQNGHFDPPQEFSWKEHGTKILDVMIQASNMLPCAEDLGVVPQCSYEVLMEYAIPGSDVQRWIRYWDKDGHFKSAEMYRKNSITMLSTHDTSPFCPWWQYEAGTVDEWFFQKKCEDIKLPFEPIRARLFDMKNSKYGRLRWNEEVSSEEKLLSIIGRGRDEAYHLVDAYKNSYTERTLYWQHIGLMGNSEKDVSTKFMKLALENAAQTSSIFCLQLLQDWLSLANFNGRDAWDYRINVPGTTGRQNWSLLAPCPLETLQNISVNSVIHEIVKKSQRLQPT